MRLTVVFLTTLVLSAQAHADSFSADEFLVKNSGDSVPYSVRFEVLKVLLDNAPKPSDQNSKAGFTTIPPEQFEELKQAVGKPLYKSDAEADNFVSGVEEFCSRYIDDQVITPQLVLSISEQYRIDVQTHEDLARKAYENALALLTPSSILTVERWMDNEIVPNLTETTTDLASMLAKYPEAGARLLSKTCNPKPNAFGRE